MPSIPRIPRVRDNKLKANECETYEIAKFIRHTTGLTQAKFAEGVGRSARAIECWEAGITSMSLATFLKIVKKYDIEVIIYKKDSTKLNDKDN